MSQKNLLITALRAQRRNQHEHKNLVQILDSVELNLPIEEGKFKENEQIVIFQLSQFEQMTNIIYSLCEQDRVLNNKLTKLKHSLNNYCNNIKSEIKTLRKFQSDLLQITNVQLKVIEKDIIYLKSVIQEYKERCVQDMLEYLRQVDVDLRQYLKPLVPNKVLQKHMKYRKISLNPSLISSVRNSQQDLMQIQQDDTAQVSFLTNHINMLVDTLETTAQQLMDLLNQTNKKYYQYVDPSELKSEPPTPIAAPLPEYFSYAAKDLDNDVKDDYWNLKDSQRKRITKRLIQLQNAKGLNNPQQTFILQERLEELHQKEISGKRVKQIFNSVMQIVDNSEELVFELLNQDSSYKNDVTLNELLQVTTNQAATPQTTNESNDLDREVQYLTRSQRKYGANRVKTPSPGNMRDLTRKFLTPTPRTLKQSHHFKRAQPNNQQLPPVEQIIQSQRSPMQTSVTEGRRRIATSHANRKYPKFPVFKRKK